MLFLNRIAFLFDGGVWRRLNGTLNAMNNNPTTLDTSPTSHSPVVILQLS